MILSLPNRTAATGSAMSMLFDGTCGMEDIAEIRARVLANCPRPSSSSWRLRRETSVSGHIPQAPGCNTGIACAFF